MTGSRQQYAAMLPLTIILMSARLFGRQQNVSSQASPAAHFESVDVLEANPNRPSSSNSAEVLAPGVVQVEYGFSREWEADQGRQTALGGEVRFGIWRNVEVRWGGNSLINVATADGHAQGFGEQYFSGQVQLRKQSARVPALALSYAVQVPTADESQGLGSGRVDHSWTFLVSREIHKFTCDFNAEFVLLGRQNARGYDQNAVLTLALQRTTHGPLSAIAEIRGDTRLDGQNPAFATNLWALAYVVHKRFVLDAAMDVGITKGSPHKRFLFGFTYAIGNVYPKRAGASRS